MKKKNVLITGCNRGIGKAILKTFDSKKYKLYGLGKSQNKFLKNYFSVDLSDRKKVELFAKKLNYLKIDVLINNAGINKIGKFHKIENNELRNIFEINFFSVHQICQGVIPNMIKKKWGRIVNISSIFGSVVKEKRSSYASSKFAINGLTKVLAAEYSKFNILSNAVAPGVIETESTRRILKNKINIIKKDIPMKRLGNVNEIANIVYWLASDENTYLTGQQIIADGGYTIV